MWGEHRYELQTTWTGDRGTGTSGYRDYDRSTTIEIDGKIEKQYKKKSEDAEKPRGEWNTVEVVCDGASVTNIINGKTVNTGTNASESKGKIVLQSEGAEIFFRNVVLTPLK